MRFRTQVSVIRAQLWHVFARMHEVEVHLHKYLKFRRRTVGPLFIESLWVTKQVSTGALRALGDLLVV